MRKINVLAIHEVQLIYRMRNYFLEKVQTSHVRVLLGEIKFRHIQKKAISLDFNLFSNESFIAVLSDGKIALQSKSLKMGDVSAFITYRAT